jgi:hypothetical protein
MVKLKMRFCVEDAALAEFGRRHPEVRRFNPKIVADEPERFVVALLYVYPPEMKVPMEPGQECFVDWYAVNKPALVVEPLGTNAPYCLPYR